MVRLAPYDGTSPWDAYKAQFELLAELNSWTDAEKAMFLAINQRGSALSFLGNLPPRSRTDYAALTEALDSRFGVAHQAELNRTRLRIRRRRRDEGLPELAEDVERLTRLAYPDADRTMLELLAKDQFIDALWNDDIRLRVRQARPPTLRAALEHALEFESYELAKRQVERPVREMRLGGTKFTQTSHLGNRRDPEELLQECIKLLQEYGTGVGSCRDRGGQWR
jgi:hypothetical protein